MPDLIGPEQVTPPRKRLLVLAGPSGVGKASITQALLKRPFIHRAMTYTTRPPRPGEAEAGQYHFVSRAEFETKFASGEIMERAEVYGTGHFYGMPANLLSAAPPGKLFVLAEVDVNGADFLRVRFPGACVSVFITAPPADLHRRIVSRARSEGRAPEDLEARLEKARDHMRRAKDFDYVVFNEEGRLEQAVAHVEAIITAERLRVPPDMDLERAFFAGAD
ncbi:MAG: guanylate kinase [Anaerolineae bacterium]|nr:guanylate kinase [Anaerolineae bacterium]